MKPELVQKLIDAYAVKGECIVLGAGMLNKQVVPEVQVQLPLSTLNRHGLIAGATGTGKTKTLQFLTEQLSQKGISSMVLDIKGDLSGLGAPGTLSDKIQERHNLIGIPWEPVTNHVEFLTISSQQGLRMRATVSEFGPVLLSRILTLNETQESVLSLAIKYADDHGLLLLDLEDLKALLQHINGKGKVEVQKYFGSVSSATIGILFRKMIELQQQGADQFFGERSFNVSDLVRVDTSGRGIISILRAVDIQDRPLFFSTFMMQLLAEIYSSFEELGDVEKPRLCVFIDEAHLLFDAANAALIHQMETMVKLIRSKGVGIFFITQNPIDIPDGILAQLGLKIQHGLRAFTARDRKAIKLACENFPLTDYYDIDNLITELGIGEALVTALNENGIPTPLMHTLVRAPGSRMGILTDEEIRSIVANSEIAEYYNEEINRESAAEILHSKMNSSGSTTAHNEGSAGTEKSTIEELLDNPITRQVGRTVARELTRGLLGVLGLKKGSKKWF